MFGPVLLLITLTITAAEKVTFFVSPDTHFTQCAGFEDAESSSQNVDVAKNLRGIHDMATLAGQPYPNRSRFGGAVERHIRGVVVPGDLIDNGCGPPAYRIPGPFSTFVKQGGSGSAYTHSTEHLESADAPAGETGSTGRCLERSAALTGSGICSGNVSACAAECSANSSCAAFTMECEAGTAGQRACAYVSTVNTTNSDTFRCVFKASVHVTRPPNFTIPGCAEQWANYTAAFGLLPGEGKIAWPVFEGLGNHDGGPRGGLPPNSSTPWSSAAPYSSGQHDPNLVWKGLIARNRRRVGAAASIGVQNYRLSQNGLHYSWDWGRVHLAMLNLYPGNEGKGSQGSALNSPSYSLQFLVDDLQHVANSTAVVLFFHYPLRGGMAFPHYWTQAEALKFGQAIKDHNVIALVHGQCEHRQKSPCAPHFLSWLPAARASFSWPFDSSTLSVQATRTAVSFTSGT